MTKVQRCVALFQRWYVDAEQNFGNLCHLEWHNLRLLLFKILRHLVIMTPRQKVGQRSTFGKRGASLTQPTSFSINDAATTKVLRAVAVLNHIPVSLFFSLNDFDFLFLPCIAAATRSGSFFQIPRQKPFHAQSPWRR